MVIRDECGIGWLWSFLSWNRLYLKQTERTEMDGLEVYVVGSHHEIAVNLWEMYRDLCRGYRASTLSALHHLLFTASWWQAKTVTDILPPAQHLQTSPPNQIKTTSSDAPAIIIYSYIFSEVCVTPSGLMSNSFSFDFEAAPFPPSHFLNLRQTRTAPWPGDLN